MIGVKLTKHIQHTFRADQGNLISAMSVGLGGLFALPFFVPWAGSAVLVFAISLVIYYHKTSDLPVKTQAGYFFLSGFVGFMIVLSWLIKINPQEFSQLSPIWAGLGLGFSYLVFSAVLALGFVMFVLILRLLKLKVDNPWSILLIPSAWVISEYLRSVLFSIISLGPNSSIGSYWNFGTLGFGLAQTPLLYLGRIAGVYGLSFIVVLFACLIVVILFKPKDGHRWLWLAVTIGLVALVCMFSARSVQAVGRIKVGVYHVQPQLFDTAPTAENQYLTFLGGSGSQNDLVVLPEYGGAFFFDPGKSQIANLVNKSVLKKDGVIITSSPGDNPAIRLNQVTAHSSDGDVIARQNKSFLIPIGESLPYFYRFMLRLIGDSEYIKEHEANHDISTAGTGEAPITNNNIKYGAIACSGAIAPTQYQKLSKQGAQVLVNSASLGFLDSSDSYRLQSSQMAKFIAVANAKPFIQAADGNQSFIMNANGKVTAKLNGGAGNGFISNYVEPNSSITPYTQFGEWIIVVGLIVLGSYSIWKLIAKR